MSAPARRGGSGLRWSAWNFVLLVPLLVLLTPMYNRARPALFGVPYFYWYQLLFVFVGVLSVAIVVTATRPNRKPRGRRDVAKTPPVDVDDLDEGAGK